jgi:hypothetical protein
MAQVPINMTTLLDWATRNTPTGEQATNHKPIRSLKELDSSFLNALLKSDAQKMKECLAIYKDANTPFENKLAALDELLFFVGEYTCPISLLIVNCRNPRECE